MTDGYTLADPIFYHYTIKCSCPGHIGAREVTSRGHEVHPQLDQLYDPFVVLLACALVAASVLSPPWTCCVDPDLITVVHTRMEYYNTGRHHSSIGYVPPLTYSKRAQSDEKE